MRRETSSLTHLIPLIAGLAFLIHFGSAPKRLLPSVPERNPHSTKIHAPHSKATNEISVSSMPGWVFTANSPAGIVMRPITSGTLSSNHQLDLSRSCQRLAVIAKSGTKTTSRKTGRSGAQHREIADSIPLQTGNHGVVANIPQPESLATNTPLKRKQQCL